MRLGLSEPGVRWQPAAWEPPKRALPSSPILTVAGKGNTTIGEVQSTVFWKEAAPPQVCFHVGTQGREAHGRHARKPSGGRLRLHLHRLKHRQCR